MATISELRHTSYQWEGQSRQINLPRKGFTSTGNKHKAYKLIFKDEHQRELKEDAL